MKSDKRNSGKFPCEKCGVRFTRPDNLSAHMKKKHGDQIEESFPCMLCERKPYKHKGNLVKHLKQHPHSKSSEEINDLLKDKNSE